MLRPRGRPDVRLASPLAALLVAGVVAGCAAPAASPDLSEPSRASESGAPETAGPTDTATPGASASPATAPDPAWASIDAAGPAAREDHTWTVDPGGTTAYLFGGRDGSTIFADLWAYDLGTDAWTELDSGSPPPGRFGHEAAWVPDIGLVVFAGQAGATFFNDLWAYDPAEDTWTSLPSQGDVPVARYGSCSAVGRDGRLWISHGFTSDGVRFADTRAYDFGSGAWTDETPAGTGPVERCLHACWLTDAGSLALYAGQTTGVPALGDLWTLSSGAWAETTGTLPPARQLAAHARLEGVTLVFGGQSESGPLDDAWLLADGASDATELLPTGTWPSARWGATLIADPERNRVLLFGGRDADGAYDDAWTLTGIPEG